MHNVVIRLLIRITSSVLLVVIKRTFTDFFFFIATNHRDWTEQIFSSLLNTKDIVAGVTSPYTDMCIISSCDQVMATTGTFSWWVGYLLKGIVLYYKNFPREGSCLKTTQFDNMDDYFLPEWIGL